MKLAKDVNPYFIAIFLNTHIGKTLFFKGLKGSGKPVISKENLEKIIFPFIDISKQNEIQTIIEKATILRNDKLMEASNLIKGVDAIIAQKIGFEFPKIELKNTFSIRASFFDNRLDPHFYLPNFKGLLDNIRKTKHGQLGDLVEFSKETWSQKDGFENEFPYIEISEIDLSSGRINHVSMVPVGEAPSRAKMVVRKNDIIVSTTRPHRGAISFIDNDKDGFIASTGFAILRDLKTDAISKEYLFYMMRTQICLLQMLQRSSGGSYPAITADELKNILIPIPNKDIQIEIVSEIKSFINQAEQLKDNAEIEFEKVNQEIEKRILL